MGAVNRREIDRHGVAVLRAGTAEEGLPGPAGGGPPPAGAATSDRRAWFPRSVGQSTPSVPATRPPSWIQRQARSGR